MNTKTSWAVRTLLSLSLLATPALGSDPADPKRGASPGASFSLSDIENINLTNGNLMLNMPLVTLPKSRGGLSSFLGWTYNSKNYRPVVEDIVVGIETTDQNLLYPSDEGGWRETNSLDFRLKLTNRLEGLDDPFPCLPNPNFYKSVYIWKLQVTMPDGSDKEFRPVGLSSYADGFSSLNPNGYIRGQSGDCSVAETLYTTSPIAYYSVDGSHIRLVVDPTTSAFSLYFPDGSYYQSTTGQLTDRNGNFVKRISFTYNGKAAGGLEDNVGRRIFSTIGNAPNERIYYQTGYDSQLIEWTVKLKDIYVRKEYQTTANAGVRERGGASTQFIETQFQVIDEIVQPSVLGGQNYVFGYSGSNTPLGSGTSSGYGEVISVRMPSLAIAE